MKRIELDELIKREYLLYKNTKIYYMLSIIHDQLRQDVRYNLYYMFFINDNTLRGSLNELIRSCLINCI